MSDWSPTDDELRAIVADACSCAAARCRHERDLARLVLREREETARQHSERWFEKRRAWAAEAALARVEALCEREEAFRARVDDGSTPAVDTSAVRAALAGDDRPVTATSDECPADPDQLIKDVSAAAWDDCAAWVQRMAESTDAEYAVRRVAQFNPYRAALAGPPAEPAADVCEIHAGTIRAHIEEIEHQTARAEKAEAALGLILSVGFHAYLAPVSLEYGCAHLARKGDGRMTCGAPVDHPVHVVPAHVHTPGSLCCGMPKHDPIHGVAAPPAAGCDRPTFRAFGTTSSRCFYCGKPRTDHPTPAADGER